MSQNLRFDFFTLKFWIALTFTSFISIGSYFQAHSQNLDKLRQNISRLDTAQLKKADFKLSKAAYLEKYGFNDTAQAIINLYFTKRNRAKIITYSNLAALTAIRVLGEEEKSIYDQSAEVTYKPWVAPALVGSGGVLLFSLFKSAAWNNRGLIKDLYSYESSGLVSDRLQRKLSPKYFRAK